MKYTLHPVELPLPPNRTTTNGTLTGGPKFNTTLVRNAAGDSQPEGNQDEALWSYQVSYLMHQKETLNDFTPLHKFFLARRGMLYAFWFTDPTDKSDSDNGGVGKVKTIGGIRYLVKEYGDTYNPYYRIIRGADPGSIEYSGVTGTPVYELGTGIITGAGSDGAATFNFRVPVAFMTDWFEVDRRNDGFGQWNSIRLDEVRKFEIAS